MVVKSTREDRASGKAMGESITAKKHNITSSQNLKWGRIPFKPIYKLSNYAYERKTKVKKKLKSEGINVWKFKACLKLLGWRPYDCNINCRIRKRVVFLWVSQLFKSVQVSALSWISFLPWGVNRKQAPRALNGCYAMGGVKTFVDHWCLFVRYDGRFSCSRASLPFW